MMQHLEEGSISNVAADVIQGSRSVEARPMGVTKVRPMLSQSEGRGFTSYTSQKKKSEGWNINVDSHVL